MFQKTSFTCASARLARDRQFALLEETRDEAIGRREQRCSERVLQRIAILLEPDAERVLNIAGVVVDQEASLGEALRVELITFEKIIINNYMSEKLLYLYLYLFYRLLILWMLGEARVELLQEVGVATLNFAQMTLFVEQRKNTNRFAFAGVF